MAELNLDKESPETTEPETKDIVVASTPSTALALIQTAVNSGLSPETLEKLYNLHERISDRFEARSFNAAMIRFQMDCPVVPKTGKDRNITVAGTQEPRRYAQLEQDLLPTVMPVLLRHGFCCTWDTDCVTYPDRILATCTLRHIDGHAITASFAGPPDDRPNAKTSPIQKLGAAETYCRRLAFIQVTGIRAGDPDTDAAPGEKITEDQALNIESLIQELKADRGRFLKFMAVSEIRDMPASVYAVAINFFDAKRGAKNENH